MYNGFPVVRGLAAGERFSGEKVLPFGDGLRVPKELELEFMLVFELKVSLLGVVRWDGSLYELPLILSGELAVF